MVIESSSNLEKFYFHVKEFGIASSPEIKLLEKYISEEKNPFSLECSCKISSDALFPERFNVWYKDKHFFKDNIFHIVSFFRDFWVSTGFHMDKLRLKKIVDAIDYSITTQIILGVDIRNNRLESRLKIWFIIKNSPERIKTMLEEYDVDSVDQIKKSIISDDLLFGFDFYPSGRVDTKIYPLYYEKDIPQLIEKKIMPSSRFLDALLDLSSSFHISFKNTVSDKIYHFRPKDESAFVTLLHNKRISDVCSIICPYPNRNQLIVSLDEKEVLAGKIISANLYY